MKRNTLKASLKKIRNRIAFLILCSLLISLNALSRQHWNRSYFDVWKVDNTLELSFLVFDYHFGPANENGYLTRFNIEYSRNGTDFYHLLSVSTGDQRYVGNWTWVNMVNKIYQANIFIRNCFNPAPGSQWPNGSNNYRVEFNNWANGSRAWLSLIWKLGYNFKDVISLRISGVWWVNGIYLNDIINYEVYPINKFIISESKTPLAIDSLQTRINPKLIDQPENNAVRVSKQAGAIVIEGAEPSQEIRVYAFSGMLVKSVVADNNQIKIMLPANQIYILHIGQARYKVAL